MSDWYVQSTFLVLLQVPDEQELVWLHNRLVAADCTVTAWREPDMGNEYTAIAVAPSEAARRMLSQLPLLLREPAMA